MRFVPLVVLLLILVVLMAGWGRRGLRAAQGIAVVIAGLLLLAVLFALVLRSA
jgi:hypothetical protein